MIPAAFAYERPGSLDEALDSLDRNGGAAKVLAGGQSLLPLLKLRVASAERLIDIGRISELRGIRETGSGVEIGALTTYREVLESWLIRDRFAFLSDAVEQIADVQVRNRGTIGGAIAHADPASDMPAILLALDGEVVLRSRGGERVVPSAGFFQGAFQTGMGHGEILTAIRLPNLPAGAGAAYETLEQPASGYSIVGVAAVVAHGDGYSSTVYNQVRVAITGVGEVAYRARAVESALAGTACGQDEIGAAATRATDGVHVNSDIHADREYRTAMAEVYVRRALEAARMRSS